MTPGRSAGRLGRWTAHAPHAHRRDRLASRERYRLLVERSPDALLIVSNGTIVFANDALARMTGRGRGARSVVGLPLGALLTLPYLKSIRRAILSGDGAFSDRASSDRASSDSASSDRTSSDRTSSDRTSSDSASSDSTSSDSASSDRAAFPDLSGAPLPAGSGPFRGTEPPFDSPAGALAVELRPEPLFRADGTSLAVEVSGLPCLYEGRPAVQMSLRDVSVRVAETALRARREATIRALVEQAPAVLWATDRDGGMTERFGGTNALAWRFRGALPGLVGRNGALDAPLRRALDGRGGSIEVAIEGGVMEVHLEPFRGDDGTLVGTVGVAIDRTTARLAEEQAREASRLEAVRRVVGGITHEMNHLLASILGLGSLLEGRGAGDPAGYREDVATILDAGRRGQALMRDLAGVAGIGRYQPEVVPVGSLVEEAAAWVRRTDTRVGVTTCLDGNPSLAFRGDREQVAAALRHLCQNALAAMPSGGELTLGTRACCLTESTPGLEPGDYAVISVQDSGDGMSEDVRAQALEPFYSGGRGTGLGLSMAYGVARQHGGTLVLRSTPGWGTGAALYLPASPAPANAADAQAVSVARPGRALVADDDPFVRKVSRRLLQALGFTVVEAEDGPMALERFVPRTFAFVLLDMRMPRMNGDEVLRVLVARDPDVRVLLYSGYTRDHLDPALFGLGHVGFLPKPFELERLTTAILELGVLLPQA